MLSCVFVCSSPATHPNKMSHYLINIIAKSPLSMDTNNSATRKVAGMLLLCRRVGQWVRMLSLIWFQSLMLILKLPSYTDHVWKKLKAHFVL